MREKLYKNSIFFQNPNDSILGSFMPTNILSIEILPGQSIEITKRIDFPGDPFTKKYTIDKLSHIEIAIRVLSGQLSAIDGNEELCHLEGFRNKCDSEHLPLGSLLQSLFAQASPGNKKIRYIDAHVEQLLEEIKIEGTECTI